VTHKLFVYADDINFWAIV